MNWKVGEISAVEADAIVNAANSKLQHDGGVAEALAKAAGKDAFQKESNCLVLSQGDIEVGKSVITGAGKLKAKHVIHTVGPTKSQHKKDNQLIETTFRGALNAAEKLAAKTVAMPLISTGIIGNYSCVSLMRVFFINLNDNSNNTLFPICEKNNSIRLIIGISNFN